jgi:ribonuclease-3
MASINSVTPKICNPWNNKNKLITSKEIHNILRNYNITKVFKNIELFQQACVHTSYKDKSEEWSKQTEPMILIEKPNNCLELLKDDNEELEHVGDGLLSGIVADYLKQRYGGQGEGFLTSLRTAIVNNDSLGHLAGKIGLNKHIIISRHQEEICNGRRNLRLLGSLFEAWLGAIYYSENGGGKGFETTQKFVISVIEKHVDFVELISSNTNYKDQILRFFQAEYHVPPQYKVLEEEGPTHDRTFTIGVLDISGNVIAKSAAKNKKVAEQEVSRIALDILKKSIIPGN